MIVLLIISATLLNVLGLAKVITFNTKRNVVVNCTKCLTFWSVSIYHFITSYNILESIGFGLMSAYVAIWLELLFSATLKIYNDLWKNMYQKK